VRKAWLNLGAVVRAAFPEDDRFRRIYALASAAMHGRTSRGIDLLQSVAGGKPAGGLGVIVLERLCDPDESMSPTFAAAMVAIQLDHAEDLAPQTKRPQTAWHNKFSVASTSPWCKASTIQAKGPLKTRTELPRISSSTRLHMRSWRSSASKSRRADVS
jgi:hypothetical protein